MQNTITHKIKMFLTSGQVYGHRMALTVNVNGICIFDSPEVSSDSIILQCTAKIPLTIEFAVGGKGLYATQVDSQGQIMSDTFVRLDALGIDGIWVKRWMLENKLIVFTDLNNQKHTTNYFGYNGTGTFIIHQTDLLEFWLDTMLIN